MSKDLRQQILDLSNELFLHYGFAKETLDAG